MIGAGTELFDLVKYSDSTYNGTPEDIITGVSVTEATAGAFNENVEFTGFSDELDGTNYYEIRIQGGYGNGASNNDSITGSIVLDGTYTAPTSTAAALQVANHIVWSDRSNSGAPGAYLNGYELVLPNIITGIYE